VLTQHKLVSRARARGCVHSSLTAVVGVHRGTLAQPTSPTGGQDFLHLGDIDCKDPHMRRRFTLIAGAPTVATVLVSVASAASPVALHLVVPWKGDDGACPPEYPSLTECHPHLGGPIAVPGFGFVSESHVYPLDVISCGNDLQRVLPYTADLSVKYKGHLLVRVDGSNDCLKAGRDAISPSQTFTIIGGSGAFDGAQGNGVVSRTNTGFSLHAYGTDHWDGTLTAAAFSADLTPPTLTGARSKTVRAPLGAKSVRVRFRVTRSDDADGPVAVTCNPASGARFRVGTRTRVRCIAADHDANVAVARFTIHDR
jgi:hypothetical protein